MRRDKSEKKRKIMVIIMGVIILLSMVVSIFAVYIDNATTNELTYNKVNFKITENGYTTKIDGKKLNFQFYPSQVESINVSNEVSNLLNEEFIVFVFDPNMSSTDLTYIDMVRYDLEFNNQLNKQVFFGITKQSSNYPNLPVLDCRNATPQMPIFVFNSSLQTSINADDFCVYLNAKGTDIVAVKDRLLFSHYKIINQ